ncbi:MAG TPA: hypothetical protein VF032_14010 [Thermoleophilaceae bacterium]
MIDRAQLAESVGQLDAGTRALLDLSLRRAIPDEQVAKVLGVEPSSIPPRRARGIAQLADMMEVPGPSELAALLIAIPELPEEAWGVPAPAPFVGDISRARRAKAFRRVAVAASPLVALGAVIAAVAVSSTDHSGGGSGSSAAHRGAGGSHTPATASAPAQGGGGGGLSSGQKLAAKPKAARHSTRRARHAARHHRARHGSGADQNAILAREPVQAAPQASVPVAYHPSAPVVRHAPQHVTHRHVPAHPKKPAAPPAPAPAPPPVKTPSVPVSTPAPQTVQNTPAQVSAPVTQTVQSTPSPTKPPKPQVPQPYTGPPGGGGGDDDDQGGCGDSGYSHSSHHSQQPAAHSQGHGGRPFTPPGLFRKRH